MHSRRKSKYRAVAIRLAAVALGVLPLLVSEVILSALDLPRRPRVADPFVDSRNLGALFERSVVEPGRMEIADSRHNLFSPASFPVDKPAGTFRIFALGGSTTFGEPYASATAFPEFLRLCLSLANPELEFEAINCGGLSYASYRVKHILQEVLSYSPDMIVVYTGHNEYLERRSFEHLSSERSAMLPDSARSALAKLGELRTVRSLRSLLGNDGYRRDPLLQSRTQLAAEVDALLDYKGGLAEYRRGQLEHEGVAAQYLWNLEQMIELARQATVPIVFVKPVCNLMDCPPIKMEVDPELSERQRLQFDGYWSSARNAETSEDAQRLVEQALAIDPMHAGANFLLGRLLYENGSYEEAKRAMEVARDTDVCPLRAPGELLQVVTDVCRTHEVPLVDAEALFAAASPNGQVGSNLLVDHIHPSIQGHQLLAEALAECCLDQKIAVENQPEWRDMRGAAYRSHLANIGEEYYLRGKQRLAGLLLWTQGRAKKVRSASEAN